MKKSKKEYKINVAKLVYAMVTTDTEQATTYGEVKEFASARQIQVSPTIAQGDCYGNGAREKSISKITGYDVQVDVNKVPIEVRAEIYGHKTSANGELVIGSDDQPKEMALGYEVEQTGETRELVWLLKGTPQPFANTVQQSETGITFSSDSITINFVRRQSDGNFMAIGDTAYEDFTDEKAETYLAAVPTTFAPEVAS